MKPYDDNLALNIAEFTLILWIKDNIHPIKTFACNEQKEKSGSHGD